MSPGCSCIANHKYLFTIDYRDDYILYTDYSDWVTAPSATPSKEYEITIKNNDSGLETKITVGVGITTPIELSTLKQSQDCGVDGIYLFSVESCGITLEKSEAILPSVNCAYTQLLLKDNKTDQDWKDLYDVFFEIEYIKSASRLKLVDQASEHFEVLTKKLKHLNCNC